MRAAVLREFGGIPAVEEVATPVPGRGEVRLRVRACGVDRFDVEIAAGKRPGVTLPLILGHEIAGEVSAVGPEVAGWSEGHRVVSSLYLVCGECDLCRSGRETICRDFRGHVGVAVPGGYAEEVVVPARNLVRLPDEIDFPQGALLANVIGTGIHAVMDRMRLRVGERVVITGAGGGVGLHAVQIARHLGAEVLAVDVAEPRLEAARDHGALVTHRPDDGPLRDRVMEWTDGRGADAVLELVGPATMTDTLPALAKGGRMIIVGSHSGRTWQLDPREIYQNEWEIKGSRNTSVAEIMTAVRFVREGHVQPIVDRRYDLAEVEQAFTRVLSGAVIGRDVLSP